MWGQLSPCEPLVVTPVQGLACQFPAAMQPATWIAWEEFTTIPASLAIMGHGGPVGDWSGAGSTPPRPTSKRMWWSRSMSQPGCRSCAASKEETPRNLVLRVSPHKCPWQNPAWVACLGPVAGRWRAYYLTVVGRAARCLEELQDALQAAAGYLSTVSSHPQLWFRGTSYSWSCSQPQSPVQSLRMMVRTCSRVSPRQPGKKGPWAALPAPQSPVWHKAPEESNSSQASPVLAARYKMVAVAAALLAQGWQSVGEANLMGGLHVTPSSVLCPSTPTASCWGTLPGAGARWET